MPRNVPRPKWSGRSAILLHACRPVGLYHVPLLGCLVLKLAITTLKLGCLMKAAWCQPACRSPTGRPQSHDIATSWRPKRAIQTRGPFFRRTARLKIRMEVVASGTLQTKTGSRTLLAMLMIQLYGPLESLRSLRLQIYGSQFGTIPTHLCQGR